MKLLTSDLRKALPNLGTQDGAGDSAKVAGKFFTPMSSFTWYLLEFDGDDTFFAFTVSHNCPEGEYGYVSLAELESIKTMGIPGVERDRYFPPTTIGEIKKGLVESYRW